MTERYGQYTKELERKMLKLNKLHRLERSKIRLIRRIKEYEAAKQKTISYLTNLESQYAQGLISYRECRTNSRKVFGDNNPEQWISYYDECISYCKSHLNKNKKELAGLRVRLQRQNENRPVSDAQLIGITFLALLIFTGIIMSYDLILEKSASSETVGILGKQPIITGYAVYKVTINASSYSQQTSLLGETNLTIQLKAGDIIPNLTRINVSLMDINFNEINVSVLELTEFIKNSTDITGKEVDCGNSTIDQLNDIDDTFAWEGINAYGYAHNISSECNVGGSVFYVTNLSFFYPTGLDAPAGAGIYNITMNGTYDPTGEQVVFATQSFKVQDRPNVTVPDATPEPSFRNSVFNFSAKFMDINDDDIILWASVYTSNASINDPVINDTTLLCTNMTSTNWDQGQSCEIDDTFDVQSWALGNVTVQFFVDDRYTTFVENVADTDLINSLATINSPSATPDPSFRNSIFNFSAVFTDIDNVDSLTIWATGWPSNETIDSPVFNDTNMLCTKSGSNWSEGHSCEVDNTFDAQSWALGNFTVQFFVDDGNGSLIENVADTDIQDALPTISNPSATPDPSFRNSIFNFSAVFTDIDNVDSLTIWASGFGSNSTVDNPVFNDTNLLCTKSGSNWSEGHSCEVDNTFDAQSWALGNFTVQFFVDDGNGTLIENVADTDLQNLVPTIPDLSLPENESNVSAIPELNWSNSTDDNPLFYVLEVDDSNQFTAVLSWYNGTITETDNTTEETSITGLLDGLYFWHVSAMDLDSNSSFSETRAFTLDTTIPELTIESPDNNTFESSTNTINFRYNFTEERYDSTTLLIGDIDNTTVTTGVNGTAAQLISLTLPNGDYNWSIRVNDSLGFSNTSDERNISISVTGVTLSILDIFTQATVDPIESGTIQVNFSFLADNQNGIDDFNNASSNGTFTLIETGLGENMQLNATSCTAIFDGSNTTVQNYSCGIDMRYFDRATTNGWLVNASVSGLSGDSASNDALLATKFSYNSLLAINMTPTALTWPLLTVGQEDIFSDNHPLVIGNTGNVNVTTGNVNMTAIDLGGETTTTQFIPAANFTVNILEACSTGDVLSNATAVLITGSTLPTGLDLGEVASDEKLFLCLESVPSSEQISVQSYSTVNVGSWDVEVSSNHYNTQEHQSSLRQHILII